MSEHHAAHGAHDTHHHISSVSQYWTIYGALMVLTVITVLAYYIPLWLHIELGAANVIIAMAIATTKASLVCLYFMHLKYDKKFHVVAFLSSLIFLALFLSFTLLDINTREDQPAFAKPVYTGKEIAEGAGGHGASDATHATGTETKSEAASAAAKPAGAATSPAASAEANPAASTAAKPAEGGAAAKPTEAAKPAAGAETKSAAAGKH